MTDSPKPLTPAQKYRMMLRHTSTPEPDTWHTVGLRTARGYRGALADDPNTIRTNTD